MPHESPLQSVHSLGRDEGSLSLNELMVLCTSLSKKVESLESELKQTKQTYHAALTKLIKRVKKLKQTIKISQARRRAKVIISDVEEDEADPSKQGRSLIEELDLDARISLHLGVFNAATALADAARRRQSVENVQTYTRRSRLVSTVDISTASELGSTAGVKAKDKGKALIKTLELQKQLDEREEVIAQAHDIDWSDPVVLRYHTLQNKFLYTGFVIHMMVEKKYLMSQDTLSKMLSRRLEVDHQSEMGYETIRRNKQELFIHSKEMDLETTQTNVAAKLPLLKQGEYEMWRLRIEQYFQIQDYTL
ncbi:hypothetical protein Tco_1047301 [Tanacetum coccineum]